ncbi:hypothetical protein CB0940_09222 [Cercospora beticola]|uniref:Uncharacterized protein n=1 Tax=Cercospora beticola TaxID=122368 RepID=A0A2G5HHJ9_CERBT|nr:hypothetical protein CB0940_09222 [Cercospora beticola]PIA92066.1 hypothetical protein CB0940_09222 [Cercospora beticola]WPB06474.1 hypothetical protein RHO25_011131 [Cercospora beticola]
MSGIIREVHPLLTLNTPAGASEDGGGEQPPQPHTHNGVAIALHAHVVHTQHRQNEVLANQVPDLSHSPEATSITAPTLQVSSNDNMAESATAINVLEARSANHLRRPVNGDVAMKVFSITELLEHILLCAIAEQMPERLRYDNSMLKLSPMPGSARRNSRGGVCLFSLQSVNKVFRATIKESTKLKRLIFLAPYGNPVLRTSDAARQDLVPYHTPLFSILDKLDNNTDNCLLHWNYNSSRMVQTDPESGVTTVTIKLMEDVPDEKKMYSRAMSMMPKGWWNAEASWKKIKVCNSRDMVPLTLKIMEQDEGLPLSLFSRFGRLDISWKLKGDETLGYVFEMLSRLLRLVADRRAVAREIERKWEQLQADVEGEWYDAYGESDEEGGESFWQHRESFWGLRDVDVGTQLKKLEPVLEQWKLAVEKRQEANKELQKDRKES